MIVRLFFIFWMIAGKKQVDARLYGMYHTVNRCTIVLIQW